MLLKPSQPILLINKTARIASPARNVADVRAHSVVTEAGIVAGGLATDAGGIKTEAQAATLGGQAGVAFGKCSRQACDTIDNVAKDAFLVNARSVAHVIATTAKSTAAIDAEKNAGAVKAKTQAKVANGGFGLVDLGFSCREHHVEL